MRALLLEQPQQFKMIEQPEPPEPGPGDVVVRIHRVGICGTDYSGYLGKMPFFSYPRIPGHELGVEVLKVGEGVTSVKPGDRCAIEPYINCQNCYSCDRGHSNCCVNHKTLGVHIDGGLRPLFTIPARKLHVSTKLNYEQLALVETLGIGCHAVNRGNPTAKETVLVIGAGPIGLSAIEFAKLSGARTVVMDTNEQRLAFVRDQMKIKDTVLVKGDGSELKAFEDLTNGNLGDVVVDATGSNKSMSTAYQYVAFVGRLIWVGISSQELTFTQPLMHRREMTFLASRNALPGDFKRIINLIETGQIDTKPWITHRLGFDEVIGAFPGLMKPENGVIKAVVEI
ncbi:zinc-binding alcohol dehydrogenase family protein [soil metagenome]